MRTSRLHLLHIMTGVLIAVFLGIHMVTLHLDRVLEFFGADPTDPTSWASMIERASQGIWAGAYIALLAVVLYHALYGLRGIIMEVTSSEKANRIVTWAFLIIGIAVFGWGTYVPIHLLSN